MRTFILYLTMILFSTLYFSCAKVGGDSASMIAMEEGKIDVANLSEVEAVNRMIDSDEFIDLTVSDVMEFQESLQASVYNKQAVDSAILIQLKAFWFRFYNSVEIVDDLFVVNAKSGASIGVSEELFNFYKDDVERLNKEMAVMKKESKGNLSGDNLREVLDNGLKQLRGQ